MAATLPSSHTPIEEELTEEQSRASVQTLSPPEIYIESEAEDVDGEVMPSRMVSVDFSDPIATTLEPRNVSEDTSKMHPSTTPLPRLVTGSPLDVMTGLGLHLRSCTLDQDVGYNEWTTSSQHTAVKEQSGKDAVPRNLRSGSSSSEDSNDSPDVNWSALDKTEETEVRDGNADETEALLLARLEQANDALATDPRFGASKKRRSEQRPIIRKKQARPPSLQMLKQLIDDSAIYTATSALPSSPPPMTELEFWTALVRDYDQVVHRLPTLTMNKIKHGVPPPLRGVVWVSMVGARDEDLAKDFDRLVLQPSPYEGLIGKDVGRSFPGVEMFKDPDGAGQKSLGRVLKSFSLYDQEIGYCQGLGFLVGPLLMHMGDKDAFCVLVKLMENYGLRSCFLPNLEGLHLRIYQFQRYLAQEMPTLTAHLASLQVEAAYLSQWFLSFFAVTCPLNMLFRIYDVIFAEGASETIMRVALSLMKRNEKQIMESREFEEIMHLLLSRALWAPYEDDADMVDSADELVNDFMKMTGIVSRESMQSFEDDYEDIKGGDPTTWSTVMPEEKTAAAAQSFLGRLWATRGQGSTVGLTPLHTHSRVNSVMKRSPSKQSFSTITSGDASVFDANSSGTDNTTLSRDSEGSSLMMKSSMSMPIPGGMTKKEADLHSQIEDLLMAMSDLQRQQAMLLTQIQREKEERAEDHRAFDGLLKRLRVPSSPAVGILRTAKEERRQTLPHGLAPVVPSSDSTPVDTEFSTALASATARFAQHQAAIEQPPVSPGSGMYETKQRLRDSLMRSRTQLHTEMSRATALSRQLDQQEQETQQMRSSLREMQVRLQDVLAEKNRLQSSMAEMQRRAEYLAFSEASTPQEEKSRPSFWRHDTAESRGSIASSTRSNSISSVTSNSTTGKNTSGLRELRLASSATPKPQAAQSVAPPRRGASLATQNILSTPNHTPAPEDQMLIELVQAKTSEAMARQELDECRSKLEQLRRLLNLPPQSPGFAPSALAIPQSVLDRSQSHKPTPSDGTLAAMMPGVPYGGVTPRANVQHAHGLMLERPQSPARTPTQSSVNSAGAWGWGWGKRSASIVDGVKAPGDVRGW